MPVINSNEKCFFHFFFTFEKGVEIRVLEKQTKITNYVTMSINFSFFFCLDQKATNSLQGGLFFKKVERWREGALL